MAGAIWNGVGVSDDEYQQRSTERHQAHLAAQGDQNKLRNWAARFQAPHTKPSAEEVLSDSRVYDFGYDPTDKDAPLWTAPSKENPKGYWSKPPDPMNVVQHDLFQAQASADTAEQQGASQSSRVSVRYRGQIYSVPNTWSEEKILSSIKEIAMPTGQELTAPPESPTGATDDPLPRAALLNQRHSDNAASAAYHGSEDVETQKRMEATYRTAPALAAVAADPEQAPKYAEHADALADIEHAIDFHFGHAGWPSSPIGTVDAYPKASLPFSPGWEGFATSLHRAFTRSFAELYKIWEDVNTGFLSQHPGPKSPQEVADAERIKATSRDLQKMADAHVEGPGAVHMLTGFVPTAIELSLAPEAAFPVLALHGYGALRMAGADPGWAMAGGVASGLFGAIPGAKFAQGLAGRETARGVVESLAAQMRLQFLRPEIMDYAAKGFAHAASGYVMQWGMLASQDAALLLDRYTKTGRVPKSSEIWQDVWDITKNATVALPFAAVGAARDYYAQKGRALHAAAQDIVGEHLSGLVNSVEDKDAVRSHLSEIVEQRRTLRQLEVAARTAEDAGAPQAGAFSQSANEARGVLRAYVTAPAFRRAAVKMGVEPEMLARRVLLNGSIGLSDAEVMKIPLEMGLESYLHDLQPAHAEMRGGVSFERGTPPSEVTKNEPKVKIAGQPGGPPVREEVRRADSNAQTQESVPVELPENPPQAPPKVRAALEEEARRDVEKLTISQAEGGEVFKQAQDAARADFAKQRQSDPGAALLAADALTRAKAGEVARREIIKDLNKEVWPVIRKARGQKSRDSMYAAGPDYGGAHDAILDGDAEALARHLDALEAQGDTFTFDRDELISALKADAEDRVTVGQVREVAKALSELRANSESAQKTYVDGALRDRGEVINSFDFSGKGRGRGEPPGTGLAGWLREKAQKSQTEKMSPHSLNQPFGEWGKDHVYQYLAVRLNEDRMAGEAAVRLKDPTGEVAKRANEPVRPPPITKDVHPNSVPRTRYDAIRVLLSSGNETDLARLTEAWGVSPVQIEEWLDQTVGLTKAERDHAQAWHDGFAWLNDLLDGARSNRSQSPITRKVPVGRAGNAGGSAPWAWYEDRTPKAMGDVQVRVAEGARAPQRTFAQPTAKQLVQESLAAKSPDMRGSALRGEVQRIIHEITFGDFNRDTRMMYNDPRFARRVQTELGEDWYDRLTGWFDVAQTGHLTYDGERRTTFEELFGVSRHLAAQAAFNFNVPVVGGQVAHLPVIGSRFGIVNPLTWRKGIALSLDANHMARMTAKSQVLPFRTERYREKQLQMLAEVSGDRQRKIFDLASIPGLALQHAMDQTLTKILLNTHYADQISQGLPHEAALREADLRTDQSMPAISVMDQSALNRDKLYGAFFLVRNFPQTIWNLKNMDDWETRSGVKSGKLNLYGGYGGLIARRLGMYAGLGLGLFLMGHGRDPHELKMDRDPDNPHSGTLHWFAREGLLESVYGSPLLHELMRIASEWHEGRDVRVLDTPVGALWSGVLRDLGRVRHSADTGEKIIAGINAAGRALGLIAPSLVRSAHGLYQDVGKPILSAYQYGGDYRLLTREDFPPIGKVLSHAYYGIRPDATPLYAPGDDQ